MAREALARPLGWHWTCPVCREVNQITEPPQDALHACIWCGKQSTVREVGPMPSRATRAAATRIQAEIKDRWPGAEPAIYDGPHEGLAPTAMVISWEGSGIDCWPAEVAAEIRDKYPEVILEPVTSWCLGLWDPA